MTPRPPSRCVSALQVLTALAWLFCRSPAVAQSDALVRARPDYINGLYDPAPTSPPGTTLAQPASVANFSGNVGTPGDPATPTDGQIRLLRSVIGQPVGGLP